MQYLIEIQKMKRVRRLLILFVICLVISGLTAFPIESQLHWIVKIILNLKFENEITHWLLKVHNAVTETNYKYPFLAYGTDWLAFAHLVIAILFVGIIKDPVKNIWVIEFGIIACISIFPTAFFAGSIRGIPIFWQFIDCSFGFVGGLLLWVIYKNCKELEHELFEKKHQ